MVLNIVNIWGIPFIGDRKCCISGRLSRLIGVFICKIRKHGFRLGDRRNMVHYAQIFVRIHV